MVRALILLIFLAGPGLAETVVVRSGEHADFSRLVVPLERPSEWSLGRTGEGYELRLKRADVKFDLSRVFDLIPKTRLTAVSVLPNDTGLRLSLQGKTHARAFELRPGIVVIDIASGAAPPNSPFERGLTDRDETLSGLAPNPASALGDPDPRLALYWRRMAADMPSDNIEAVAPGIAPDIAVASGSSARITEAEQGLLFQLGRAASQGVVTPMPQKMVAPQAESPAGIAPATAAPLQTHLAIRTETVFDRDTDLYASRQALNPQGDVCPNDEAFAIANWRDDRPPILQIGERRRQLVGEFDQPSEDAVLRLARLYLALGFGAEARALLKAFPVDPDQATDILMLAAILEDREVPSRKPSLMTACDGHVALWALLGTADPRQGDPVNTDAILRAFSALPVNLRRDLGARLAEKLFRINERGAAKAVQDAISRASGAHLESAGMINAQFDMLDGRPERAQAQLTQILQRDGPETPAATILYIESILAGGQPADEKTIEAVAALAFEHRHAADGPALIRAHSLAAGSSGMFDRAFEALQMLKQPRDALLLSQTVRDLFGQIAAQGSDETFLLQFFRRQSALLDAQPDWDLRQALAERLLSLGFAAEARLLLGDDPDLPEQARLLRARAHLVHRDGAAALRDIAGSDGPTAARLRGQALRLLGDHKSARDAFAAAGAPTDVAVEAWRGGEWSDAAISGNEERRAALVGLGLVPPRQGGSLPGSGSPPPLVARDADEAGPLMRSKALLEGSQQVRLSVEALTGR